MAFAADLSTLTDALITSVAKIPPEQKGSTRTQGLKRRIQSGLRTGSHTRTDQFAVAKQLEGLQEKFQVLNRDELAEALQSRLAELEQHRNLWLPEILSLFLQLSDRPALHSTVHLTDESAKAQEVDESLSWSELKDEETAFNDEEIWEQVDFAGGSSDDDFSSVVSDVSLSRQRPQSSTTVEEGYVVPDDIFLPAEAEDLVSAIEKSQFWRPENYPTVPRGKRGTSRPIAESQLARELMFMLQGLPTSVFRHLDDGIKVDHRYTLANSSSEALASLLQCFCEIGTKINCARRFTKVPQAIPYMQTFCRGIEDRLLEFDKVLSQVQCNYLSPGSTISLLQLLTDVRQHSHELVLLSEIISTLMQNSIDQPMRCLDLLYDLICMLEALGDETSSQTLARLFFACFKTYTRSTRLWMETGQVDALDSTFFVKTIRENGDLRTLWHDWFVLDMGTERQKIPQFLATSIQKVFTAGKSMVFLRHLNTLPDTAETHEDDYFPDSSNPLPFSALVDSAFERLVNVDHSLSAGLLRTELDQQCGLWTSLEALHHIYLGKDMSATGALDTKIFELEDRGRVWDRFLLTEIARTAFNPISVIDISKLLVRSVRPQQNSQSQTRSVGTLQAITIDYGLPWPIANIITEDALHSYQRISTFLMQIRRAKYSIVKERNRDARTTSEDSDTLVNGIHHNMIWFLDFLYGHLTYLVISTATENLSKTMSNAEDVDAMIAAHQSYMSSLEAHCLLSKELSQVYKAIISILDLCLHFADLQTAHLHGDDDLDPSMENRHPQQAKKASDDDLDSEDDDYDDEQSHDHTLTVSFKDSSYDQQMRTVKHQFDRLAISVTEHLKGLARADGLPSWEILAERLEWRRV